MRALRSLCAAQSPETLLLIDAGLAPESFTGPLRRFGPDVVLLADAAEMGEAPGAIETLDWRKTAGFGPSTHLQPLSTLAEYLTAEIGCQVLVVGIQPGCLDFEVGMSPPVHRAVRRLAVALAGFVDCGAG